MVEEDAVDHEEQQQEDEYAGERRARQQRIHFDLPRVSEAMPLRLSAVSACEAAHGTLP